MATAGRNKGQSAGVAKSIKPEMKQSEQESIAKWGADRLPTMDERKMRLAAVLQLFYGAQKGPSLGDKNWRLAQCAKASKKVEELMIKALWEADAGFFADLSDLIPLAQSGKGVSPVELALLGIWSLRDPERCDLALEELESTLPEGEWLDRLYDLQCYQHAIAKHDIPEWPASVSELKEHFKNAGYSFDVKTIRDSIKKLNEVSGLNFPVRDGRPGRKKN
jgi:hypothetical protein